MALATVHPCTPGGAHGAPCPCPGAKPGANKAMVPPEFHNVPVDQSGHATDHKGQSRINAPVSNTVTR
jgi:hypothetical protein